MEQQVDQQGEKQPKRVPGRPFKKGQSGNPSGKKKRVEPVYDEEPIPEPAVPDDEPEPSPVLLDLRWAYRNFGVRCRGNPQQMAFREMLEGDRPKFMDLLTKHEQMHQGRVKESSSSEAATSAVDEGTEKSLRILDEWLADPSNWGE